jgi:hypothetical protein
MSSVRAADGIPRAPPKPGSAVLCAPRASPSGAAKRGMSAVSCLASVPAIRFAQDLKHFNDPSAIRPNLAPIPSKTAWREEAGPAPVRQGCRWTRHRFAACGLDRLSLPRHGLAKRSWLTMSEPLLSRPGNRHRSLQVFAAGSAQGGINRFRKQPSCRMLAGCLILATGGPDASGSGFHPTTFGIALPRRNVVRAGRPGTTCRTGG